VPVRCGHLWICDGASATIDPRPAIRPHVTETATAMLATAPPEQVRALLEPLGTGAFVIGVAPDGRLGFVALNRRHGALTGVAPGAAAGIGVADALPPDPAARLEEACRRYDLSVEEFMSWQRLIASHGIRGLRATRLQDYRAPADPAAAD